MPQLSLKNVPEELVEQLRRRAQKNRRSLNREAIVCLEQAVRSPPVEPRVLLARIAGLHEGLDLPPLTDALLADAKAEGRP